MNENVYQYASRIVNNDHHEGKTIKEMAAELLKLEHDYYELADDHHRVLSELHETKQELDEVYRASQHI